MDEHGKRQDKKPLIIGSILLFTVIASAFLEANDQDNKTLTAMILATVAVTPAILSKEQVGRATFMIPYLAALSLLFVTPLLGDFDNWGFHDWDLHMLVNDVSRATILDYAQIPYWNPYFRGGNPLLTHWASQILSPSFILILAFGTLHGMKIQIITHTFIGLTGCLLLSRHLKLKGHTAYLPGVIFMLNSFYSLHLTVGHHAWIATCWLPWAFTCYLKGYEKARYMLYSGFFTAMILFEAHGYLFGYTITFITMHALFRQLGRLAGGPWRFKTFYPVILLLVFLASTFMISGVKLFPTLVAISDTPYIRGNQPGFSLRTLILSLTSKEYISTSVFWHNKSAYMGYVPLLLALAGIVLKARKETALILTMLILAWASFTLNAPLNMWEILHSTPLLRNLRAPTRLITMVVFCLAIFAGYASSRLERLHHLLPRIVLAYCIITLVAANSPVFANAFTIEPYKILRSGDGFQQVYSKDKRRGQNTNCHAHFLANQGTINCRHALSMKTGAVASVNDRYRGEAYVLPKGKARITSFTPNKVTVEYDSPGTIVLNQNYMRGWLADGEAAKEQKGLVAARPVEGAGNIVFEYKPPGILPGALLTAIGLSLVAISFSRPFREKLENVPEIP
ncbi:hypothetical protein ACFLRF_04300 [Candidatus Altiarchaeota archaeon]